MSAAPCSGPPFHSAVIAARVRIASNAARARASSSPASASARACPNTLPASDCANIRASTSICLRRVLSRFTGIESPCFNAFRLERALPAARVDSCIGVNIGRGNCAAAKVLYAVQEPFQKALLTGKTTQAANRASMRFRPRTARSIPISSASWPSGWAGRRRDRQAGRAPDGKRRRVNHQVRA